MSATTRRTMPRRRQRHHRSPRQQVQQPDRRPLAIELLEVSKPTAGKAIDALVRAGILKETSGRKRDRVYAYQRYVDLLTGE